MPLPKPRAGEGRDRFLDRCMDDAQARTDFPERDQRFAVCNSQWRKRNKDQADDPRASEARFSFQEEPGMESMDRIDLPFECKVHNTDDEGVFEGLGAVFGNVDRVGDIVERGAFSGSLRAPKRVKMLLHHDVRMPVGVWEHLEETSKGLLARGRLNIEKQLGRDTLSDLKMGVLDGLSIGFRVGKNGSTFDPEADIRRLTKIELLEISIVAMPANDRARVRPGSVKQMIEEGEIPSKRDMEMVLRDVGLSQKLAKSLLARGYSGLTDDDELARQVQRDAGRGMSDLLESLKRFQQVISAN